MQKPPKTFFDKEDFTPQFRDILSQPPLDPAKTLLVGIAVESPGDPSSKLVLAESNRQRIAATDGKQFWHLEVESLRSLFRGNRQPPVLGAHPEVYNDSFILFDLHVLQISRILGDRRDQEMEEIYSTLRRRPDGRSLGFVHDYMWQAAALILGTRTLSQAEFEAIMARLERSCRTFAQGPSSRNHVAALRSTFGQV